MRAGAQDEVSANDTPPLLLQRYAIALNHSHTHRYNLFYDFQCCKTRYSRAT